MKIKGSRGGEGVTLEEALELALYTSDPAERDDAERAVVLQGHAKVARTLCSLLDAPQRLTRRRAARLLTEMRPERVHPVLVKLLADESAPVRSRCAAARILSVHAEGVEPALGPGLSHAEARIRRACATPSAPVAALEVALADESEEVASRAAEALLTLEVPLSAPALESAVAAHEAAGRAVPEAVSRALASAAPASEALARRAQIGDVVALDHVADVPTLMALLAEAPEGSDAHAERAWSLARVGRDRPERGAWVAEWAEAEDPRLRAAAARLARPEDEALLELLADSDNGVRWLAHQAERGAFDAEAEARRVAPHERLGAVSARPPYGIGPDDALPEIERPASALALCHTRFDVNLGVAIRSAEAAGLAEAFLVGRGGFFRSPARGTDRVIPVQPVADPAALLRIARARGYQIVAVQQSPGAVPYHRAPWPPRPLFVLGAEDTGVPLALRAAADLVVEIPQYGVIDSLNVAAAATCVMMLWRAQMEDGRRAPLL